jgi:hypothetical protein
VDFYAAALFDVDEPYRHRGVFQRVLYRTIENFLRGDEIDMIVVESVLHDGMQYHLHQMGWITLAHRPATYYHPVLLWLPTLADEVLKDGADNSAKAITSSITASLNPLAALITD